ncbi:MAG: hypothetical protein ACOYN0_03615, partial [Phycisphaerales bacterium]
MKNVTNRVKALSVGLALTLGLCVSSSVFALDRVTLKDGTVYEGDIVREESCCVWLKITKDGKKQEKMFFKSDTSAVERGVDAAAPADKPAQKPQESPAAQPGAAEP